MTGDSDRLSQKQERFCVLYVECGSGTEAYKRAYSQGMMSDSTASASATRLLKNARVKRRIVELREENAALKVKSIRETQAYLSELLDDSEIAAGTKVQAARTLLQSLGAFDREPAQQVNVFTDSEQTVLQFPAMLTEEECLWHGED